MFPTVAALVGCEREAGARNQAAAGIRGSVGIFGSAAAASVPVVLARR